MYYKVVQRIGAKMFSCSAGPGVMVEYVPGELTVPVLEGSKLFIFQDEYVAYDFAKSGLTHQTYEGWRIWSCQANGVGEARGMTTVWDSPYWVRRFWEWYVQGGEVSPQDLSAWTLAPEGTLWCDSLMLIQDKTEEVEYRVLEGCV